MSPFVQHLKAFQRIGNPVGVFPSVDTQFYLYFCDHDPIDRQIILNQGEFTEYKWLSPDEILDHYC